MLLVNICCASIPSSQVITARLCPATVYRLATPLSRGSPVAGEGLTCHGELEVFQYTYHCRLNLSKFPLHGAFCVFCGYSQLAS